MIDIEVLIAKNPKLTFLRSSEFKSLSQEKQEYVLGLIEDAEFWANLEKGKNPNDGFKFIAAAYGLQNAEEEAKTQGLEGKDREKFLRPHQDLFTMFNPYSGNGRETQKAPDGSAPTDKTPKKK